MSGPNAPSEYVKLAFWIERHYPGYVDAYFGPPELKAQAMAGDLPPLEALEELAAALGESIASQAGLAAERRLYLEEELRAMRTTIRILKGNAPSFVEEVELLYGVTPAWVDESGFEEAHRVLDGILPGSEPLAERVQGFRERSQVPVETAVSIMHRLMEDFRGRTLRLFGLPPGEQCQIEWVDDQPWRAYNWYLGERKSRIEINRDFPMELWEIPITLSHEAYPGHHSEHAIKEQKLYLEEGRLEHAIALINSPSSLVSEGIAKNALAAVASEAEMAAILIDCYEQAGLPEMDGRRAMAFIEANRRLESVTDNQVLLLNRDRAPDEEVVDYGMRYSLTSREDELRALRFYQDPLSRSYTFNYTLGSSLIAAFLERAADRQRAFQRLLSEPLTPAQIRRLAVGLG
jgi:hypothetical protein